MLSICSFASSSKKRKAIEGLLKAHRPDVRALRQHAITGQGLISNELRCKAWPLFFDLRPCDLSVSTDPEEMEKHRDYSQVQMDVHRCGPRLPSDISKRKVLIEATQRVIMKVLVRNPELHYYQGFHDICLTLLYVVKEDVAVIMAEKLALCHLRDHMEKTMNCTSRLLDCLTPLLRCANKSLFSFLQECRFKPHVFIGWVVTWFSHYIGDINTALRLFDFFLAHHPMMPVYLSAAVILHERQQLLMMPPVEGYLCMHLLKAPSTMPFESLLTVAETLYKQHPPSTLLPYPLRM